MSYLFPEDFCWGTATAAYQIEGAIAEAGRKPTVWDTFSELGRRYSRWDRWRKRPMRVRDRSTGAIACDHYHRYAEDVKWMAELGVKHYRFSLAWSRILPEGRGKVNEAGVDFYKRLVDCLGEHGIMPHATLFHWDSPQALEDEYGSWRDRRMAEDFAHYATETVRRLGDRITDWMTLNEIVCFTHMGYGVNQVPVHAPGTVVSRLKEVWQTSHHALLAHGLGCQAIRAASPRACTVSLVENFSVPVPLTESVEDMAAARRSFPMLYTNGGIALPALTGAYSTELLESLGADAPDIQSGDLAIIHQPLDWLGLNVYSGVYVRAIASEPGYEFLPFPSEYPRLFMPWLWMMPDCLYWAVRHVRDTLGRGDLPIMITENGCAADDRLTDSGEVLDSDRILYLREHLRAAHRVIREGYPLKGYFLWSLMDNFEWSWGYSRRFGIIYTDYSTQRRIPKASYTWYRECIRQNRVV